MMIQPHKTITIDDAHYRMIPEQAFLSLQALARQVRAGVKIVNGKSVTADVAEEHVLLALKALTALETE
jgi:cell division protein ZapA (FtsZ GTPase activity inhibitor)